MPISWRWFWSIPGLQIGKINLHPQQVPQHKLAESTWRLWHLWNRVTWFRIVLGQPNSILFYLYTLDVFFPDFTWPSIAWPLWRAAGCCDAFRYPTDSNEKLCLGKVAGHHGRLELTSGFLGWSPLQTNNDLELSIQRHAWKQSFKAEILLKLKNQRSWYQVDTLRFVSFFEGSTLKFKDIINTWVSRPFLIEARIILQDVPRHCLYCRRDWIITNPWSHPTKILGQKEPSRSEEQTWRLPDRELQAIGAAAMFHMLCISCSTTTMLECLIHILQTGYHSVSLSVFFSKPAWKGSAYFQRC